MKAARTPSVNEKIHYIFKKESGKLIAVLTKTFGTAHIDLAEDVLQEALIEAIEQWNKKGLPTNPEGWLYKVAKNKAVNIINKEKTKQKYISDTAPLLQSEWTKDAALNHIFSEKEIADDQLRMIFTCCHPSISSDSQIALTLKTLCGFSIPEIATAFLTTEENINKRLGRARKTIRDANLPFMIPVGTDLTERIKSVLEVIYLLFNEGYNATVQPTAIRRELCNESIHLAELLIKTDAIEHPPSIFALLALMYLNASRFNSRIDEHDLLITLEHQDRSIWDREMINKGILYLEYATKDNQLSSYHILATISAYHATATSFEFTEWKEIVKLYDHLSQLENSPIVLLNRAIAISKTHSPQNAISEILEIENKEIFENYFPYYTTLAALYCENNEAEKAIEIMKIALEKPAFKKKEHEINTSINQYSKK